MDAAIPIGTYRRRCWRYRSWSAKGGSEAVVLITWPPRSPPGASTPRNDDTVAVMSGVATTPSRRVESEVSAPGRAPVASIAVAIAPGRPLATMTAPSVSPLDAFDGDGLPDAITTSTRPAVEP